MEKLNNKKKEFRSILVNQGSKEAIQAIRDYLHEDSPKQNTIVAIEGRIQHVLKGQMKGIHSDEYIKIEQNKIRDDILILIDEIAEADTLPNAPKEQMNPKQPFYTHRYFLVGSGTILLILIFWIVNMTTSVLTNQSYMFDIEEPGLAFRSKDTITLKELSGHQLDRIYVQIDQKGDYFSRDNACNCWHIDLKRYHLREGMAEIKIGRNPQAFQDVDKYTSNFIEIDNTIAEGIWEAQSTTINDSLLVEVKGLSNEKVNLDITLPFVPDSIETSFQIIEEADGFYFFQQIKIPRSLAAAYKDTEIPIFISDDAGNQVGAAITLDMLERGNVPPMFFGDHYKYFAEGRGFINVANGPIDQPQNPPLTSTVPPSAQNDQEDSLVLSIAMFSPKMIGLSWQLKNAGNREIEYSLYKRIAKGIIKDTLSKFVPVDYFSAASYNDVNVQAGYVYEYYVEARDKSNDQVTRSNQVRQGIPPALQQMAQRLRDFAKVDSSRSQDPKIPTRLPTSDLMKGGQRAELNAMAKKIFGQMVFVEGGKFTMGGNRFSYEKPAHPVTLSSFFMGKTEVTQELWEEVMGNNPSYFKNCAQCPVENVSWNDVQKFIQKLNQMTNQTYRLPTEAEWEFAARGGVNSQNFEYAGSNEVDKVAWYGGNSNRKTHPVGTKGANELGLYDMSGNVYEWCQDWYSSTYYEECASRGLVSNPQGPTRGSRRVLRGGRWGLDPEFCRVASRRRLIPDLGGNDIGFRLVLPSS